MPDGLIASKDLCNQSVVERVLADASVVSIKLAADLESDTYDGGVISVDPGTTGWRIERITGDAVFDAAYIRGTLTAASIAAANITAGTMDNDVFVADGTITAGKIGANEITANEISLTANITGTQIASTTITGGNIDTGTITATNIQAGTLTSASGVFGTISADDITTGTLNAATVTISNGASIGSLSASSIDTGTMAANYIGTGETGAITITIGTGGKIQSTDVDPDVVINGDGSATFKNVTVSGGTVTASLVTGALSAATIAADDITAGTIGTEIIKLTNGSSSRIESNDGSSWYIRGDGVALFNNVTISGTLSTNSVTGWLTSTGTAGYRTRSSGERIEIKSWASGANNILFYDASGDFATINGAAGAFQIIAHGSTPATLSVYEHGVGGAGVVVTNNHATEEALSVQQQGAAPIAVFGNPTSQAQIDNDGGIRGTQFIFYDDNDNKLHISTTNTIAINAGGTDRVTVSASALTTTVDLDMSGKDITNLDQALPNADAVGSPAYSWEGDTTTGVFRQAASSIGFATGGNEQFRITNGTNYTFNTFDMQGNDITNLDQCLPNADAVGSPAYSWEGDTNTGLFSNLDGYVRFASNGSEKMSIGTDYNNGVRSYFTGLNTATTGTDLILDGSNEMRPKSSSRAFKKGIRPAGPEWATKVRHLQPVTFQYKKANHPGYGDRFLGLIAEDTAQVFPELVTYDTDNNPIGLDTYAMSAAAFASIQDLYARIEQLEKALA
jgi:hypothetical protein